MGYFVNLPPRYVHQIEPQNPCLKLPQHIAVTNEGPAVPCNPNNQEVIRRRVSFDDSSTRTFHVPASDKDDSWYSHGEILCFKVNWNTKKRETATPRKLNRHVLVGRRVMPLMEDVQTFSIEHNENRKNLIKRILEHQGFCRSQGFSDPAGVCILSKSMSRGDRKSAWRAAATNAYEVDGFNQEQSSVSLGSLFMDYYWQSIHPLWDDPLSFLSDVVFCQRD